VHQVYLGRDLLVKIQQHLSIFSLVIRNKYICGRYIDPPHLMRLTSVFHFYLFGPLLDLFGPLFDLSGPLLDLFGPPLDLSGPLPDLFGPLLDLSSPILNLSGPLPDLFGSLLDPFGPLLDLSGPLLDLFGPLLDLSSPSSTSLIFQYLRIVSVTGCNIIKSRKLLLFPSIK
jgi:hypothetical protein